MFAFHIPRHMTKWRGTKVRAMKPWEWVTFDQTTPPSVKLYSTFTLQCNSKLQSGFRRSELTSPYPHHRPYTTESFKTFSKENPILLRDACQCPKCVDPSTHQRDFSYADIPTNISVSSVESDSDTKTWRVSWTNDIPGYSDHVSTFLQSSLVQLLDGVPASLDVHRTISVWDKTSFAEETKEFDFNTLLQDDNVLSTALELIQRHGLVFVTSIPQDPGAVRTIVTRLTGLYRNTFYGETWDVKSVPQAKNVAYTSKYLGFHMDLLYMKESPGLQLLHCLQNSCTGGESEFLDTFKAIDVLRQDNPRYVERLTKSKIRYGYSNDGHFYSDDKPVIKLHTPGKHTPQVKILGAKDPEFMQSVECTYWSPPFINSIANAAHDGDVKEFIEASKAFSEVLQREELIYEAKLPEGTCAVFDNLRVVHARKAFDMNSGKRWLKGVYGDRQDVLSRSLKHVWKE